MKVGEFWIFKKNSKFKKKEIEDATSEEEEDKLDLFFVIYPEVIYITKKLQGDMWLVTGWYEKDEPTLEAVAFESFFFESNGEKETHELSGTEIYKNYDLLRDEKMLENWEEGELYELKDREDK